MFQLGKKPKKAEETEHPSLFEVSYHFACLFVLHADLHLFHPEVQDSACR